MDTFEGNGAFESTSSADLRKYLWLLWRWAWLIVLTSVVTAVGVFIFSQFQTPVYQAETTILVNESPSAQASNYAAIYYTNQQLTKTYAEMLTKKPLIDEVRQRLGLDDSVPLTVSVNAIRDTQLLRLVVENHDPFLAANVANELVVVFIEEIQNMQESKYLSSKENLQSQLTYLEKQIEENAQALDTLIQNNINQLKTTGENGQPIPTSALEEQARQINQAEIDRLETRMTQYRQIYASVLASYEQIRLAEAQTSTSFIQVENAVPPQAPIRPQIFRNTLLAAIVGAILAIGGIFAIEFLDDSIRDPETITSLSNLPILATISRHEAKNNEPITQSQPRSPISEAFRSLRTNVRYTSVDRPIRKLIVTSPTPEDGKTTVTGNLAVVMAQSGANVVLVDADLRRPRLHKVFGLDNKIGLTSIFISPSDRFEPIAQTVRTEGLKVIPSGGTPPNPSELLASRKMSDFLNQVAETNDLVLIDTPPVLTVTDAVALSHSCDGVLLVVKMGQTKQSAFTQAVENLRQVNANIIGVVVNDVDVRSARYHYYYRNYYYNYTKYYADDPNTAALKKKSNGSHGAARNEPVSRPIPDRPRTK